MTRFMATILLAMSLAIGSVTFPAAAVAATDTDDLRAAACGSSVKAESPWHIANLFDCASATLFIPYQLCTGAEWDGRKDGPCMHPIDKRFDVTDRRTITIGNFGRTRDIARPSATIVKGPVDWIHPETGETLPVWVRSKASNSKLQRFMCHEKGIGRVTDYRWPTPRAVGRCKFPAGHGWKLGVRRDCDATSIKITDVELDGDNTLRAIKFKWWVQRGNETEFYLDRIYRYQRGKAMTDAWKQ